MCVVTRYFGGFCCPDTSRYGRFFCYLYRLTSECLDIVTCSTGLGQNPLTTADFPFSQSAVTFHQRPGRRAVLRGHDHRALAEFRLANLPGVGRSLVFRRGGKAIGSMFPIETVFPIKSPSEGPVHSSVRTSDHLPVSTTIGVS